MTHKEAFEKWLVTYQVRPSLEEAFLAGIKRGAAIVETYWEMADGIGANVWAEVQKQLDEK